MTAPGGRGAQLWNGRPPQPSGSRPRLKREEGDPPYAARSAAGVSGVPTPDYPEMPGSPAASGGTPARRCTSAAVTGPRAAALTGVPLT